MGTRHWLVLAALTATVAGCAEAPPPAEPRLVQGDCADVYGASVCTWANLAADGSLLDYGATIPMALVEGAPSDGEMVWPPVALAAIAMPAEVTAATGVDHMTVYWEPHGHPPGPYLTPHFDFHVYSVPGADREAVDCADVTKPAVIPAGYVLPDAEDSNLGTIVGLCVPKMGMHALPEADLMPGASFGGTMVMGYYHGQPTFFEPMISRDHLLKRASFELAVPAVEGLPAGVRYPATVRAVYDAEADAYRFVIPGA